MKFTAYQPTIGLPLYLVQRVARSQAFVLLDDLPISKAGANQMHMQNANGMYKVSLPLYKASSSMVASAAQPMDLLGWQKKLEKSWLQQYGKAPHWNTVGVPLLKLLLDMSFWSQPMNLYAISRVLWEYVLQHLGVTASLYRASTLAPRQGDADDRLIALAGLLGAKTYVSGGTAIESYMNVDKYKSKGVAVEQQAWKFKGYESPQGMTTDSKCSVVHALLYKSVDEIHSMLNIKSE